jgi:hypothetical protein
VETTSSSLGAWEGANLGATARQSIGAGADSGLPSTTRFVSNVAKLVRKRRAIDQANTDPLTPSIFLLKAPAGLLPALTATRIPMLDNGLTAVAGRIWFVSEAVVSGWFIDLLPSQDSEIFEYITDHLKLGDVPAIIVDPRTTPPSVRYYPMGLSHENDVSSLSITVTEVTLSQIFDIVDHIHSTNLVTPGAQASVGKLWKNAGKFRPSNKAEQIIQMYLKIGLAEALPTCTIRQEQSMVAGRLDLEVELQDPLDPSKITRFAILELKVLRSFGSSGNVHTEDEVLKHVQSGVEQALSYRDERQALSGALCCFDMRTDHTSEKCFSHVRAFANEKAISLRLWFIFASSEKYRKFITSTTK